MIASPRRVTSLITAVCVSLAVIGCDKDKTDSPTPKAANPPAPATSPAPASEVRAAVAANMKFAMDDIITAFHEQHPDIKVAATYGSSGNFVSQLTNRAPFDIFISADIEYPQQLVDAGVTVSDSIFTYAIGQIVVWVHNGSPIDVKTLGIQALAQPSVKKIAIANPEHAPYGRAAVAAMKSLGDGGGVYDRVKDRLVLGENIAQTAQFVESGAADIGIIALSLALAPAMKNKGTYWNVPLDSYPPLEQGGVILSWAKDVDATQRFKAFVIGAEGRAILKRYGFVLPGE